MQLNSVIDDLATGTYQVTRPGPSVYVGGILQTIATLSTFTVRAVVQPAMGAELQSLPEAQRTEDVLVIYATTELKTRTADNGPDQVAIGGQVYEVFKSERWSLEGERHWRAYASRRSVS